MAGKNDPTSEQDYLDAARAMARGEKLSSTAEEKVNRAAKQAGSLGKKLKEILG